MDDYLCGKEYLNITQVLVLQGILQTFLNKHSRIVYGKKETRKLLIQLKELPVIIWDSKERQQQIEKEWEAYENEMEVKLLESIEKNKLEEELGMSKESLKSSLSCRKNKNNISIGSECWDEEKQFLLHSYFRYLQANDETFEDKGKMADAIQKFAEDIMDGENLADQKVLKSIYDLVADEMGMSEEELEELF